MGNNNHIVSKMDKKLFYILLLTNLLIKTIHCQSSVTAVLPESASTSEDQRLSSTITVDSQNETSEDHKSTTIEKSKNNPNLILEELDIVSNEEFKYSSLNGNSVPKMDWLGKLLNHHDWWEKHFEHVTNETCKVEMLEYIHNLRNGTMWAAKMHDASGRYSGQFFFGNDFWLGSKSLCYELMNPNTNRVLPPFSVKFNMVKLGIYIDKQYTPMERRPNVGLCLPESCTSDDIRYVIKNAADEAVKKINGTSVSILRVRSVPGEYVLTEDYKFHIICSVGILAIVLIIAATAYEMYLNHVGCPSRNVEKRTAEDAENACNNNTLPSAMKPHPPQIISIVNAGGGGTNGVKGVYKHAISAPPRPQDMDVHKHSDNHVKNLMSQLLLSFSALTNGSKILDVSRPADESLSCLHGMRFFSLAWVIMVHTYLQVFSIAENKVLRKVTERNFLFQTVSNATFSVDSFFFISGLLVTILYYRTVAKSNPSTSSTSTQATHQEPVAALKTSSLKFVTLLTYRFIRLTPAYLFVLGMNEIVLRWAHNNSVFEPPMWDHVNCAKFWWRNALYINSLFSKKEMCMLWSWYMSNDTQFYVIGIIILLVSVRHFRFAAVLLGVFLVSSWITTFSVAYHYNYHARIEEPFALFDQLYDKPWSRIGPYLVGMSTGWLLFKLDCKLVMPKSAVICGWILSVGCLFSLVYGLGKDGLNVPTSSIYVSLGHTAWGLGLAWITVACCTGYGGIINHFLSFRGLLPLSRLTFCAYLVHPMIMCMTSYQMDGPVHLHNGLTMIIYFGNCIASYLMSFAVSLAFEAPVVRLLKILMTGRRKED